MDLSLYLNEFLIFTSAMIVALISPGPDFAMVVKNSVSYGKRSAIFTSIGIGLGIGVHMTYILLGVGLIISKSILLFNIIKYLGAIYLIYVGYKSLKSKGLKLDRNNNIQTQHLSDFKSFLSGFICNVLNPKATLFFLSMFTVVVSVDTPLYIQAFYGFMYVILSIVWFVFLTFVLTRKKVRNFLNIFGVWFDRFVGAVLILLGLKVAFSK